MIFSSIINSHPHSSCIATTPTLAGGCKCALRPAAVAKVSPSITFRQLLHTRQGIHIFTSISTLPLAITHLIPVTLGISSLPFMPFCSDTAADCCARFGAHLRQLMKWECASSMVRTHRPCCSKSQHRIVLSSEDESKNFPPGWNARARTQLSCPVCLMSLVGEVEYQNFEWLTTLWRPQTDCFIPRTCSNILTWLCAALLMS